MCKQLLRTAALCIAAAVLLSAAPLAPANIAGQWQFTVELAVGTGRPLVTFKQDGEKITGTYEGRYGKSALEVRSRKTTSSSSSRWLPKARL